MTEINQLLSHFDQGARATRVIVLGVCLQPCLEYH